MRRGSEEPHIESYATIEATDEFTRRWLPSFTFEMSNLNESELRLLRSVSALNIHFPSALWDDAGYIRDFMLRREGDSAIFCLEAKSAPRSRLRSYKGVFTHSPLLKASAPVEIEVPIEGPYTHIVGAVRVNTVNADDAVSSIRDAARAFALLSPHELSIDSKTMYDVLDAVPRLPGPAYINYARLLTRLIKDGLWLLRFAGYSGGGDSDVQVFFRSSELIRAEAYAKRIIAEQAL